MKQVSEEYKNSMKSMMRNRSYVKVEFSNIDVEAAADGVWVSNGEADYSDLDMINYAHNYPEAYATLEWNRWILDGTSVIIQDPIGNVKDGFVSDILSGETGTFTQEPTLTRTFSQARTFQGITLTFDTRSNEWPLSVTVSFYFNGEIVGTKTASPTSSVLIVESESSSVDKVEVVFHQAIPYRRIRVEQTSFGVQKEFTGQEIVSTSQSHDVDPLSRRLPTETFQFTILDYEHNYDPDNPQGTYIYVDEKSPVSIQYGYELPDHTIEWIKPDRYLLDSKPTVQNNQATFSATGLIGSLNDIYYKGKTGNQSFYDMALSVLEDANLGLTPDGKKPWEIDESLKSMYSTAALPIDTHMNCLQLIAHACRCRLYTDDDNVIHIRPFGVTVRGIYSGQWSDNGHSSYSEWETVDRGNDLNFTYATLELNRWILDGKNQKVVPWKQMGLGYLSESLSNASGTFDVEPEITRTFDVPHNLSVIKIQFDTVLGEYPSGIQVQYYRDSALLDTQMVNGIDFPEISVTSELASECDKIVITLDGGLPYRRVRVSKVYYRENDFTLDFSSIAENSQKISKIDSLKAVTVAQYSYTVGNDVQTLFEGSTTDTQFHVEFSSAAQDVQIQVEGGELISSKIYARAADLELPAGTKNITIKGKTLSENSTVTTYPVSSSGEIDKEENPLITNQEMRDALAEHVASYLQMRNTYDVDYRGNPEIEVGDIIGLQTLYTGEMDALVLVDEISFNGSLSGKMKVKGLI
ncbi:MAG: hypothetical protein ACLU8W_09815 [Clostridia bacterium]